MTRPGLLAILQKESWHGSASPVSTKNHDAAPGPAEGRPERPALKELRYIAFEDCWPFYKKSWHGAAATVDSTKRIMTRPGLLAVLQKKSVQSWKSARETRRRFFRGCHFRKNLAKSPPLFWGDFEICDAFQKVYRNMSFLFFKKIELLHFRDIPKIHMIS